MSVLRRPRRTFAVIVLAAVCACGAAPAPTAAASPLKRACGVVGAVNGLVGKACSAIDHGGTLVKAGTEVVNGQLGGAVSTLVSGGASLGLAAIGAWVLGGASFALHETATLMGQTTAPQLRTTWFSSTYWRMAGIAAVLTLPFLFAAVVQALLRSDLALLARAALGYLPLAILSVSIAAPLTMLLLAASDQMSAIVSSAAGNAGADYLERAGVTVGGLSLIAGSPFLAFLIGLFTAAGAVAVWMELLMREAAVYVIVLMLPLAFAALVWPARRVWAVRAVELLVALIFSKFAIVAVLSLGGAAMSRGAGHSIAGWLAGLVLLVLGAFAPWAMLRLLPLAELASNAVGSMRIETRKAGEAFAFADGLSSKGEEWAATATAKMRRDVDSVSGTMSGAGGARGAAAEQTARLAQASEETATTDAGAAEPPAPVEDADQPAEDPARPAGEDPGRPAAEDPGRPAPHAPDQPGRGEVAASDAPGIRAPEMPARWQASDTSWRPLALGLAAGWPPPELWTPGGEPAGPGGEQAGARPPAPAQEPQPAAGQDGGSVAASGFSGSDPGATQDDADPLPPPQDPPDGRL